jgi:hypothetical protein
MHARLLGRSVLGRSTGRLEPAMLLKLQVVPPSGRSKTGTCERGLTVHCNEYDTGSRSLEVCDNDVAAEYSRGMEKESRVPVSSVVKV